MPAVYQTFFEHFYHRGRAERVSWVLISLGYLHPGTRRARGFPNPSVMAAVWLKFMG
jgi:hypothetical protein